MQDNHVAEEVYRREAPPLQAEPAKSSAAPPAGGRLAVPMANAFAPWIKK